MFTNIYVYLYSYLFRCSLATYARQPLKHITVSQSLNPQIPWVLVNQGVRGILKNNVLVPVRLLFYCFPDRLCHTGLNHDLLVFLMLGVEI